MLAKQHANLGVAGFIGAVSGLAAASTADTPWGGFVTGITTAPLAFAALTTVAGAFALMPDLDEPGSTVSRKFGVVSQVASHIMKVIAFGHRGASHSLLFAVICGFLGFLAEKNQIATGLILFLSFFLIVRLVLPIRLAKANYTWLTAAAGVASYFAVTNAVIPPGGLPFAMFSGVLLHVLGDSLTPSGTRVLWPLPIEFRLPVNGRTGATRELYITQPILIVAACAAVYFAILAPLFAAGSSAVASLGLG